MTVVRNLTKHPVTIVGGRRTVRLPPHTPAPRITEEPVRSSTISVAGLEFPLHDVHVGSVVDLPEPVCGTVLIVPRVVAAACVDRADLVVPFDELRDGQGRVVGCRALARLLPAEGR